jgi:hypothetical protein
MEKKYKKIIGNSAYMKKIFFSQRFLFIASLFFSVQIEAQNLPYKEVSISSPTAAALGKYGDFPVSYHTGIPQINIPLYTVKEGPLSLPISISYHASGLKVLELASWVGAGWSLNAGGVITRSVQGAPDEKGTNSVPDQTHGYFSDSGINKYIETIDINGNPVPDFNNISAGKKDGEPDLYFFNFGSYSGKFYFRDDRTPVIVPEQDVRIVPSYSGSGSIGSFVLTTPDGVQYFFGNVGSITGATPIETTQSFTLSAGLSSGTVTSSWYLNKIQSADAKFFITLQYTSENYGYPTISMFPVASDNLSDGNASNDYEYKLVKNIISGVRLSQINFSNGTVSFVGGSTRSDLANTSQDFLDTATTQAKSLAYIQVSDGSNFCKKYKFSYDYFTDNTTALPGYFSGYAIATDKYRLKLDSIQEISCDSSVVVPAYVFNYFTDFVPRRLSFGIDHWGFYNGVTSNSSLIPTYTINGNTTVTGANRDAAWPAMRGGQLQKIIYPTGGHTEFDFEAHSTRVSYSHYVTTARFGYSMGYDGSSTPSDHTETLSGNSFTITLSNATLGGTALLNIYNSGGTLIQTMSATPGNSQSVTISPSSGSYRFYLIKSSPSSGHGASFSTTEYVPTLYQNNEIVGGMRIKTLTQRDANTTNEMATSFSYLDNSNATTGILFSRPTYVQVLRNDLIKDLGYWNPSTGYTNSGSPYGCLVYSGTQIYYKSPSSLRPMATTQGNHIGYNEVKVSKTNNSYSIYRYYGSDKWNTVYDDVAYRNVNTTTCSSDIPNFPEAPLPQEYKRGELKYEGHFNQSAQLLKEVTYQPVYEQADAKTPALMVSSFSWTSSAGSVTSLLGTPYYLNSARKTKDIITTTEYSPGAGSLTTTDTTYYASNYHHQPTKKISNDSKNQLREERKLYAFDLRAASCDTISNSWSAYVTDSSSCQATYSSTVSGCAGISSCLTCAYFALVHCRTIARNAYVDRRLANYTGSGNRFDDCIATAKSAADATLKPVIELQTQFQNPMIEILDLRNTKLVAGVFNRYRYSDDITPGVYPSEIYQLPTASPQSSFTNAAVSGNTISKDTRYEAESQIKFVAGNVAEVQPKDGITKTYFWDYNYQEPTAQITNAAFAQCAFTSFEADGKGNWDYTSSGVRTDSGFVTGKKAYALVTGDIQRTALESSKTYLLTYWLKNNGGTASVNSGSGGTVLIDKNGWKLYLKEIQGESSVTVSGSGVIDELRLYPKTAQMTTYTYDPLIGIISQCDPNNRVIYYEYDDLYRLLRIRDHDKNIIKAFDYKYQEIQ